MNQQTLDSTSFRDSTVDGNMQSRRPKKPHEVEKLPGKHGRHNEQNGHENGNGNGNGFASQIPCHSVLSDLRGLDNLKVSRYYRRGSVLFAEGQTVRGVYVLCEGRAKVSISSSDGKTLLLRIAKPGDLLGINASLTGQPYGSTVQTLERCRTDFISREDLLRLLDRDKRVYASVARALSQTLNSVLERTRLIYLSQSSAEKLARLLIQWCDEHGKRTAQGIRINAGLTHEEMAQMIGASRETVTRALNDLKRDHTVNLVDNYIFVCNRKALEAVARCGKVFD